MSFTMAEFYGALRGSRVVAEADAALAFVQIDQDALRAEHAGRIRWERWDGESNVGAARPTDIRGRADYGGGEVYLVYIDDQLVYLQPHAPDTTDYAPIATEALEEIAERQCETILQGLVFQAAIEAALQALPVAAQTPTAPVQPVPEPASVFFTGNA